MPCCSGLSKSNALRVEDRAAGVREGVKTPCSPCRDTIWFSLSLSQMVRLRKHNYAFFCHRQRYSCVLAFQYPAKEKH